MHDPNVRHWKLMDVIAVQNVPNAKHLLARVQTIYTSAQKYETTIQDCDKTGNPGNWDFYSYFITRDFKEAEEHHKALVEVLSDYDKSHPLGKNYDSVKELMVDLRGNEHIKPYFLD